MRRIVWHRDVPGHPWQQQHIPRRDDVRDSFWVASARSHRRRCVCSSTCGTTWESARAEQADLSEDQDGFTRCVFAKDTGIMLQQQFVR